jgi:hypothetical protein
VQRCLKNPICADILRTLHREHVGQPFTGAIDPALDRAHAGRANLGRLLIRDALCGHEQQGFTLPEGQLGQGSICDELAGPDVGSIDLGRSSQTISDEKLDTRLTWLLLITAIARGCDKLA